LNKNKRKNEATSRRAERSRRAQALIVRCDEEKFLGVGRFSCHAAFSSDQAAAGITIADRKIRKNGADKQVERRSGRERRCGIDTRSEIEHFLQGERRSGLDRREFRYMSFRKARAFARNLGLRSASEWRDYVKSGLKPNEMPAAPHYIYAKHGWAGWGDFLKAGPVSGYLSQYLYRSFAKFRALARQLGLASNSKGRAYDKSAKELADNAADSEIAYTNVG